MAQTLVSLMVHVVFSTKNRQPMITPEIEPELYAYLDGTAKNLESRCLAAGGTENHLHLLLSQSKTVALSHLMEELKKGSSKWIKTKATIFRNFGWQDGYGAFTIGESQVEALKLYIAGQKERHKKLTFEQELVTLLNKYHVSYDERYLWI
ncbi:MAG: IS200/IS605 family transposase [Acidobacteriota bacterium]|nr:IS200/IS605 family transposase [Acidobacteriota bacterium]